jgi:hypothetical protein
MLPEAYRADLAHALSNHRAHLSALDRYPEARPAEAEAIRLRRDLPPPITAGTIPTLQLPFPALVAFRVIMSTQARWR